MLTACISLQWGFHLTEIFDTDVSCSMLKSNIVPSKDCYAIMLSADWSPEMASNQLREGCYCKIYDDFSRNASAIGSLQLNSWLAKDTLRVLGRTAFKARLSLTYESFGDGM